MGAPHAIRRKAGNEARARMVEAAKRLGAPCCASCLYWHPESRSVVDYDWCTRGSGVMLTHWDKLCVCHEERQ